VVSAYAAAIWGRLESLPQTFVGALILGVGQVMLTGYLPSSNEIVTELAPAVPFVLLFAALLLRSQRRLPEPTITPPQGPPPRSRATLALAGTAFLLAIPLSRSLKDFQLVTVSKGLVFACVIMSLILLTGLSGQVSIMQMSFAGIGAVVLGKLPLSIPYPVALAVAAVAAGAVGLLVALPAVRLRGVYLALSTLAFAVLMDSMFFGNSHVMGGGTTLAIRRPSLFGWNLHSERAMFVVLVLAAGVFANVVLAVRRSHFGRVLAALRDSPLAAQMQGMNITAVKLKVFGVSALMAGLAGALLGSLQVRAGQSNFMYIASLSILLIATVFGVTNVTGALLGAFFFAVLPNLAAHAGSKSTAVQPLLIGGLAVLTARHPEGIAGLVQARVRGAVGLFNRRPAAASVDAGSSYDPDDPTVIDLREPAVTSSHA
jgi:branched-chain amino acid transport system permease protein